MYISTICIEDDNVKRAIKALVDELEKQKRLIEELESKVRTLEIKVNRNF